MINHILDLMSVKSVNRPTSGASETTMEQRAYKIKNNIFIWDMPGLGGKYFLSSENKYNLLK